jgi:hypothetical protein
MKAYKHLVKHCLANNCLVSVWDGEEWQLTMSSSYKAIIAAIESVEEAQIRIIDKYTSEKMGWALIIPFGLEDDETVADNTMTAFMEAWDAAYQVNT